MTPRISKTATLLAVALGAGSLCQVAMAHDHRSCKSADGDLSILANSNGTTSGTIRHGGKLNGTTRAVFTSALTATPNPGAFSYTDDFSVTTDRGILRAHNIGLFVVTNGLFSEIAIIDPGTSTGGFAAATGTLYINGKTSDGGATFQAEVTGEYCLAD